VRFTYSLYLTIGRWSKQHCYKEFDVSMVSFHSYSLTYRLWYKINIFMCRVKYRRQLTVNSTWHEMFVLKRTICGIWFHMMAYNYTLPSRVTFTLCTHDLTRELSSFVKLWMTTPVLRILYSIHALVYFWHMYIFYLHYLKYICLSAMSDFYFLKTPQ